MAGRDGDRANPPTPILPEPDPDSGSEPPRPVTLASRRGFDGKHLHVRVDAVRLPSGRESVREVVEHPGSVAVVALTAADELILIRQFHHAIGRALLGLPAGTAEPGERPEETARRELREETGYAAAAISPLIDFFVSPGYTDERMTLVLAEGCARVGDIAGPDESLVPTLVPMVEAEALLGAGPERLAETKTLVGLLLLLRRRAGRDAKGSGTAAG
ncbi:MAG: ADP-ribose pyrophosphatase [uncultured Thermomicrobiales bacterium]|uniref:GDP-mannose pyrophosphatase n=1 Tax=uncultured Thermomicrobiales bacterium TaxID=1645740 RepID=A0A6J4VA73_9BACT|nr:MAG: ADP-ribose pyrophosphatase [uncultured Thermomicrobiales bacterium]